MSSFSLSNPRQTPVRIRHRRGGRGQGPMTRRDLPRQAGPGVLGALLRWGECSKSQKGHFGGMAMPPERGGDALTGCSRQRVERQGSLCLKVASPFVDDAERRFRPRTRGDATFFQREPRAAVQQDL